VNFVNFKRLSTVGEIKKIKQNNEGTAQTSSKYVPVPAYPLSNIYTDKKDT
jgi:hypothetical protein